MTAQSNSFIVHLLRLQQDGDGAVSAPTNWGERPVLYVETELDKAVEQLAADLAAPTGPEAVGRWYFFVGSPGNGKSAATGHLARQLIARGLRVTTEVGDPIDTLPGGAPPYRLLVSHPTDKRERCWIAQDASVLPNPYSSDPDPARELGRLLEDAAERGVSVVVCTNRGVLEKLLSTRAQDPDVEVKSWFRAVATVAAGEDRTIAFGSHKRQPYAEVRVTRRALDRNSLLLTAEQPIFEELTLKAIAPENWKECVSCEAAGLCPFFQNRNWLADGERRERFITILKRAEAYSGRVLVFREAVALLSAILAGCPRDYKTPSPCDWVRERVADKDVFTLLAKRIYSVLFSAYAPGGFELDPELRLNQITCLRDLLGALSSIQECAEASHSLELALTQGAALSSDVGVLRLLGEDGALRTLDVFSELVDGDFFERWASAECDFASDPAFGPLEQACIERWRTLGSACEGSPRIDGRIFGSLARWISAFSVRAGALLEGRTAFGIELDELVEILEGKVTDPQRRSQLRTSLKNALQLSGAGAAISPFGTVGDEATGGVLPRIEFAQAAAAHQADVIALVVKFGSRPFFLPAPAYVWLRRREEWHMDLSSFPHHVLRTAQDALAAAAAESNYDLPPSEQVVVNVRHGHHGDLRIVREPDGVWVQEVHPVTGQC